MASYRLRLLSLVALATVATASITKRSDEYDDSSYSDDSSAGFATGAAGFGTGTAASLAAQARLEATIEKAHGVLGCLAFAFFFPVGAMILRLLPGRLSVILHAIWQIFAWLAALVTLGMGVWMAKGTAYIETYHAIIGMFVIAGVSIQPITGFLHHLMFKKAGRRTIWSYAHMYWGIPIITLGIINGGFGLQLADADTAYLAVYGVFAALIWVAWMGVSVLAAMKRSRGTTMATKVPDSDTERIRPSEQIVRDKEMRQNYN